jgi:formate dehydrogenase maturation protein FdhE
MVLCPFCDGQGLIDKAKVKDQDIQIYICEECDTMWKTAEIREDNCENFRKFMNSIDLKELWTELDNIERL